MHKINFRYLVVLFLLGILFLVICMRARVTSLGMYSTYPSSPVCVRFIARTPFASPTSISLKVKNGKLLGDRSVSVSSDNRLLTIQIDLEKHQHMEIESQKYKYKFHKKKQIFFLKKSGKMESFK